MFFKRFKGRLVEGWCEVFDEDFKDGVVECFGWDCGTLLLINGLFKIVILYDVLNYLIINQ